MIEKYAIYRTESHMFQIYNTLFLRTSLANLHQFVVPFLSNKRIKT